MKTTIRAILLAIACIVITTGIHAQSTVKATIPFDFTVGQELLPQGTYVITSLSSQMVQFDNWDKLIHLRLAFIPTDSVNGRSNRMVFQRNGDRYFLTELRGGSGEYVVSPYRVRRQSKLRQVETAAADLPIEEIALK